MKHEFFEKYDVTLDEGHALKGIVDAAKKVYTRHVKGKDYEDCLRYLEEMIIDFKLAVTE